MELTGKRVVVTGGGSGFGKGIAAALVKRGVKVWITGRDAAKLERAAELMVARGSGAIVNVSSVCALYAWPGWGVYTAAKAGLSKFSHALYAELRPHGVRVTCLTPSWGRTDFDRAAGIVGAPEDPALSGKCIAPDNLGTLVVQVLETPDHLAVPDVTIQPMIQEIVPM